MTGWEVIHWELCKKFKFVLMNKWYMCNPESVLENGIHKLLLDFEIQMDHLIWVRTPDLVIAKIDHLPNSELHSFSRP